MGLSRTLYVCGLVALAFVSLGACSSESKEKPDTKTAGQGSLPPVVADNVGSASPAAGSAGMVATPSTSAGASGAIASSAGTSGGGAGASGNSAGTSGGAGSAGSMAAMAGSSAAGAGDPPDAGVASDDDPLGLFGPEEVSCEGLLCVEAADCATLYPDENATCKFTNCVDFECM
jgi:hypothetical protein